MRDDVAGPDGSELSEWLGPDRLESTVNDDEFNTLCEAHSFGAVARGEFPLMPRGLLKALVDAAVAAERERWRELLRTPHRMAGACPDEVAGADSRDLDCPACRLMLDLGA
jgi:hypothetical protein